MEILVVVVVVIFFIIGCLSSGSDSSDTSSSDNARDIGVFEVRLRDAHFDEDDDDDSPNVKVIEAKGLIPVQRKSNIGFITSILDISSDDPEPVLCALEIFQEEDNIVFQHQVEVGETTPNEGFIKWVRLGVIPIELIQPPYSGKRDLVAIFRMVDLSNPPSITHGFSETEHSGLLWQQTLTFSKSFEDKGYSEAAEHRDEAMAISLKIGMAVAMADGDLDDKEGDTLKQWILRAIEPFSDEKQQMLKKLYNEAMKDAYADAINENLSLSDLTNRLNEIGEKTTKYEALELCFDVMAADGVADKEEIHMIRKISEVLELDIDEINKMRDRKIIGLDVSASDHANIEILLGIDAGWSKEQIKKHLRSEFQKWNNRINTLNEGKERDNAQRMLDLIAEARKKYA